MVWEAAMEWCRKRGSYWLKIPVRLVKSESPRLTQVMLESLMQTTTDMHNEQIWADHSGSFQWSRQNELSFQSNVVQAFGSSWVIGALLAEFSAVLTTSAPRWVWKAATTAVCSATHGGWAMSSHAGLSHQEARSTSDVTAAEEWCSVQSPSRSIAPISACAWLASAGRKEAQGTPGKD